MALYSLRSLTNLEEIMLKGYLTIAFRSLRKNHIFSFINIAGLAIGMSAFLFIVHYIRFERSYEDFHTNADNIYRITLDLYNGSEYVVTDCESHASMGPILRQQMPEVKDFVRMYDFDGLVQVQAGAKKFFEDKVYFADPSLFTIFSVNVLSGDARKALRGSFEAVVTESAAKKYFDRTDVIGESIHVQKNIYHVTGVIADLPVNTHLKFNVLLSHASLPIVKPWYKEDSWNGNNEYTYLLMQPGTDLAAFNRKLADLSASLKDKINNGRYTADPIKRIHLYSNKTYEPEANGNGKVVSFLTIVAGFILVIAWVNYINLSTARALERAREVGIRKVMGSVKSQLIFQFLSESAMVNLIAGTLAFVIFQTALPLGAQLTGAPLPTDTLHDAFFWKLFSGLLLSGALLSGIYPAFVLSSFRPATVLKGKFRSSAHGKGLRSALVIFQFSATVVLIIGVSVVYLQVNYLRNYSLGMNVDHALVIRAPMITSSDSIFAASYESLKTALLQDPEVKSVTRSETIPGASISELNTSSVRRVGQNDQGGGYEYYHHSIDADFIKTLNMKLVAGRNFRSGVPNHDQVMVNEEAAKRLGFRNAQDAIGGKITYQTRWPGEPASIIGVLQNFHQRSPKESHLPMIFYYSDEASYFTLRIETNDPQHVIALAHKAWDEIFTGSVFNYFFLDQKYNQQFQADVKFGQVLATFSGLAVVIACLGLFGLSSYTTIQRTKEIGIRKVLGASVRQIVQLLSVDFTKVVLTASVLAVPAAYFITRDWLSNYAVRIDLHPLIFVLPVVVILLIALLTVSVQTLRSAMANPTESLKQE
jgi:putative ABC transport system permease protein